MGFGDGEPDPVAPVTPARFIAPVKAGKEVRRVHSSDALSGVSHLEDEVLAATFAGRKLYGAAGRGVAQRVVDEVRKHLTGALRVDQDAPRGGSVFGCQQNAPTLELRPKRRQGLLYQVANPQRTLDEPLLSGLDAGEQREVGDQALEPQNLALAGRDGFESATAALTPKGLAYFTVFPPKALAV